MRITDVRGTPVRVPLTQPTKIATRTVTGREFLLVHVETDAGQTGLGYTYAGTVGGWAAHELLRQTLRPRLVGEDPRLIGRHWEAMYQDVLLLGRRGVALRAISAVDMALWDVLGKLAGLPLYQLLGGQADAVPAYASGGYYSGGDPIAAIEEEMASHRALGFTSFKMKVGGAPFDVDVARVRAARAAIGPSGRLALDANNAWRTPYEAIRFARAVEDSDIWWLEEPLPPDDVDGHAEIARALEMPVATGEIHATRWEFRDLIERRAADILQPDAVAIGGVSEWMRVAQAAATFNLPVAAHANHNLHVHLTAAVPNGLVVEHFRLDRDIYNFERLLTPATRLQPRDGMLPLPTRPGFGMELDEEAVARWTIGPE